MVQVFVFSIIPFLLSMSAGEVEDGFLQHRLSLQSCDLKFHVSGTGDKSPRVNSDAVVEFDARVIFDGENLRMDRFSSSGDLVRTVAVNSNTVSSYTPEESSGGLPRIAKRRNRRSTGRGVSQSLFASSTNAPIPNPRLIGASTQTLLGFAFKEVDALIGNRSFGSESVTATDMGDSITRLNYSNGIVTAEIEIDRDRDYEPVRIEIVHGDRVQSVTNTLQHIDGFGWYPETVTYDLHIGDVHQCHQVISVEVASINEPIAEEEFSLASMGMPESFPLMDLTESDQREMQEKLSQNLDRYQRDKATDLVAPVGRQPNGGNAGKLIGYSLLIIATGFVVMACRRRRD